MNWDEYFLHIACVVSKKTKCMSRAIGAVLVRDDKYIVGTGYNGPPISVKPCSDLSVWQERFDQVGLPPEFKKGITICPRRLLNYKSGEGIHMCPAAHAERNAIDIAARMGQQTKGCAMYLTCGVPCLECAKTIIQAGIVELICPHLTVYEDKPITGAQLLTEAGVAYRLYNCDSKKVLKEYGFRL